MGDVYIYDRDEEDFSTIGICGALQPKECIFHEIANGKSSLRLEHPLDPYHRYLALQENRILKADVPVRTTPEIMNGSYVTVVERWFVKNTATKVNRYIYNKANPSAKKQKKLKLVPVGAEVIVISKPLLTDQRWKVKYTWTTKKKKKTVSKTVTGYIDHSDTTLELRETVTIENSSTGIEQVAPSWRIEEQLFRIVSVEKHEHSVIVEANHISYDLLYNLCTYAATGAQTLSQAANAMLDSCIEEHTFTFQTNIAGTKTGFDFRDKDPITALLDPDIGLIPRWHGELIRDNYHFTVLDHAGVNRGTTFMYGKNVKGITVSVDYSDVATAIRPIGEDEKGNPLYLEHSFLWNGSTLTQLSDTKGIVYGRYHHLNGSSLECDLPFARVFPLKGEDCKVDKKNGPNATTVRNRLRDQAIAALRDGAEQPKASVSVDMQQLGYTHQWERYRELEKVFLFDTVRVRHPAMNIDLLTPVCEVEWDCIEDKPLEIHTGAIENLAPSITSWQITGLDGAKLTFGSVGAAQMASDSIRTRHIQAESIVTDSLAAQSVTAEKIAAGAIDAMSINAVTAHINEITAETIDTDALSASIAKLLRVVSEDIQTGRLTTDTLSAVTAGIVTLTAKVGSFDLETVTNLVSQALVLQKGLANTMTITNLAVTSANLLNATIGKLVLLGEDGLYYEVGVGTNGTIHTSEYVPTQQELDDGKTTDGRAIVTDETINAQTITGETVMANEALFSSVLTAALNAGQITANEAMIASASIPMLYVTSVKALGDIIDISANQSITMMAGELNRMIRLDSEGLHVGELASTAEVLIDPESVNVVLNGTKYSKFAGNYVQFGNYQLRRSSDGGLVFKMA